jgi:hypothetical protein
MKTANQLQASCIKGEIAWHEKNFGKVNKTTRTDIGLIWIGENAKTFREIWDSLKKEFKVSFKPSWDCDTVTGIFSEYELNELLSGLGPDFRELAIVRID